MAVGIINVCIWKDNKKMLTCLSFNCNPVYCDIIKTNFSLALFYEWGI